MFSRLLILRTLWSGENAKKALQKILLILKRDVLTHVLLRRAAVGALGSIHRVAHHKYFSHALVGKSQKATGERRDGEGGDGDGGLTGAVIARLFSKDRGVRISSACAVLEMCSLSTEEKALPAELRSKRQFVRDDCCWGAEGVADVILARLRQAIEEGFVSTAATLSPMHSPLASSHSLMPVPKASASGARGGIAKGLGSHRVSSAAGQGPHAGKQRGGRGGGVEVGQEGETGAHGEREAGETGRSAGKGGERAEEYAEEDAVQLEGLRLLLYLIGMWTGVLVLEIGVEVLDFMFIRV